MIAQRDALLPWITCICCTMPDRKEFLARAIKAFEQQTYENKTLLLIPDSIDDVGEYHRFTDKAAVLCPTSKLNYFQKLNLGCIETASPLIAVWDDDDYSTPLRLRFQAGALQRFSGAVTGFRDMKFTDGEKWWQFQYRDPEFVLGTSLMFRREWWSKYPFEPLPVGAEAAFSSNAHSRNQLLPVVGVDLMYATIHAGNTSKRRMNTPGWTELPGFEWKD